jgi:isopentenyl diphosphate isomerase/L-lactate dehydrogenase-like FMN-dependent dehydrogenase
MLPAFQALLAAADEHGQHTSEMGEVISSAAEAINVFDFHAVTRQKLPPAHYGYLATGTDEDNTLRANRDGFRRVQLRVRRLVDVTKLDTSVELFGSKFSSPIALSPAGSQNMFDPQGELAVARAAAKTSSLQILSTNSTASVEDVARERGGPVWYQLYANTEWRITKAMIERAERAGCPAIAWTVDTLGGRNTETFKRFSKNDTRDCTACHGDNGFQAFARRKPMFNGFDLSGANFGRGLTWEYARRVRDATSVKLLLKGIVTAEDAELCVKYGMDGLIVSNHGGRAEASGRGTIECLEEVAGAVGGRMAVLIDGGIRRGTDIFKALALGADAVGIGRPYLWGLAAFGQEGVNAVIDLLRAELELVMKQAGTPSIGQITRDHVQLGG